MQIARHCNLHPGSSPQLTDLGVASEAAARSHEPVRSKAHMAAVSTAALTPANLMFQH